MVVYYLFLYLRSCRRLNDGILIELGVLDANHRRAILNKAGASGGAENITDDFDNMLGDLDSVIKDLEMFSVVVSYTRKSIAYNESDAVWGTFTFSYLVLAA